MILKLYITLVLAAGAVFSMVLGHDLPLQIAVCLIITGVLGYAAWKGSQPRGAPGTTLCNHPKCAYASWWLEHKPKKKGLKLCEHCLSRGFACHRAP